jgi:Trypsin-like peptidase domain
VYAYADGKETNQIYVMESIYEMDTEVDLMVLYSPAPLPHASYPKPGKSRPLPYSQTDISLIAYHGDESRSIYLDYPTAPRQSITDVLNSLNTDRLSIVKGITGSRNDPNLIFHRCSSAAGSSGGPLVNGQGELIGMTTLLLNIF